MAADPLSWSVSLGRPLAELNIGLTLAGEREAPICLTPAEIAFYNGRLKAAGRNRATEPTRLNRSAPGLNPLHRGKWAIEFSRNCFLVDNDNDCRMKQIAHSFQRLQAMSAAADQMGKRLKDTCKGGEYGRSLRQRSPVREKVARPLLLGFSGMISRN